MRTIALAAAFGLALAGSASAQQTPSNAFSVQNAAMTPSAPIVFDGLTWRCGEDNVCVATGRGTDQPATRACRRLAGELGLALASFTWQGTTLSDDQLAACNNAAAGA
jgi:hypothetical protein